MNPEQNTPAPHKKTGVILGVIIVLIVAFVTISNGKKNDDDVVALPPITPSDNQAATTTITPPPTDINKKYSYKDGTYSSNGTYNSPGGENEIAVTISISNDVVTTSSVSVVNADNTSRRYIERFISGQQGYVVGRNIGELNLTKVSGSSLTPKGFNDALSKIKAQAQV